jgi:glutathione S-transferase
MKLYDWKDSYNSQKIRAVAFETDQRIECVPVNMQAQEHKLADHIARNPNGKVPVLTDGSFNLWESDAILCYVASKDPARRLLPSAPVQRAQIDQWLFWKSNHLAPAIGKVAYERFWKARMNIGQPDETAVAAAMPDVEKFITILDGQLAKSAFLAGDLSVADFSMATVFQARKEIRLDLSAYPNVTAWLGRIESRPSWQNSARW